MFATSRSVRIAAIAMGSVVLIACGQPSPEKLMTSAKEQLAKGERSAAIIELRNVLQQTPGNGEARLMLGQVLFDAGEYASAEKELGRALELKQPHEKVLPPYAHTLLALGKDQLLVEELRKYKLFDPNAVATTQTALGDAYRNLGDAARAREAYAAAIAAVPGYPRARLGEAKIIAAEGRIDESLIRTDEVIAVDPRLGEAHSFRADLLLAKGDRIGGRKALESAIETEGKLVGPRLSLIRLLTDEREYEAAEQLLKATRKVAPRDLRVTYLEAVLAFRKGDVERAQQQVEQVLKFLPDHLPALVLASAIDLQRKQYVAAETKLRKVVARAPNHLGARQLLMQTYLSLGQPAKAKEVLQPMMERGLPDDPRLRLLAGEAFLANGDTQRAAAFYQDAAKGETPQQAAARLRLAQVAFAAGRTEAGFAELETASELDAGSYHADLALIASHLQRNEIDKAMEAAKTLEKKQPKNPLTFQMYGLVNLARRDADAARNSFQRALELQPNYLPSARSLAQLDLLQKKPDDARKRFEAMIAKDPNNEQLLMALAEFQVATGASANDVIASLRRAVQADPQAPGPRLALIGTLMKDGDSKAAMAAAQEAVTTIPSDPRLLDAAGAAMEAAGEINQAISTYNKLATLQPQAVHPLYRLAALYIRQNDTDKAIETLRRVQKIAPRESRVVTELAQVYLGAKRYDEALKEARDWQRREPKSAVGYALEGDIQLTQRNFAEAERLYRQALKVQPDANAVAIKLHGTLSAAEKKGDADAWSKKWIAEHPKDAAMRLYLGGRELAAKNLKASAAHYQAAISIAPNSPLALNNLAWISGELGDPKALSYAERALKLAPNNAVVLDTYGMLLVKKGEADKALPFLERGRKIAPARHDLQLNYAKALIKAGRKDDARNELVTLSKVTENFAGKDEVAELLKSL